MFSKDDDFNFIAYNILVFLQVLGCCKESNKFQDITKLSYIGPFISDGNLLDILVRYQSDAIPNLDERNILREVYIKNRLRVKWVFSILFALERQGTVELQKNEKRNCIDIWLVSNWYLKNDTIYQYEIQNALQLKLIEPKIKTLKIDTLLDKFFKSKGVTVWEA